MADKIRGITIEIGGDTSELTKSLKNANSEIKDTQKQLKDVEKLLKLDPTNIDLLRQKEQLLKEEVSKTKDKVSELKKLQDTMDANGVDKNSEQYMALQREIIAATKEVENLEEAAQKSNATLSQIGAVCDEIADKTGKLAETTRGLSTAAGAALGAIGGAAYSAITASDDLNTLAKQTGFSTAELQKFQYASDLIDVSVTDITGSIKKMRKAMVSNSKDTQEAFASIGVSVTDANGELRDSVDVFYDCLEGLSKLENETERDTTAMFIFGKSADNLAGIVDDGGQALRELGQQAEDAGLILSQDTLDSLNAVNDEIDTLKATTSAAMAQFGSKAAEVLLPVIQDIIDAGMGILEALGNMSPEMVKVILGVLAAVAALSPLLTVISAVSTAVGWIVTTLIPALSSGITWLLANPIALVIAAIAGLVLLIATKGDEIQAIIQTIDDFLQNVFAKDWCDIFGPVLGEVLNGFFATLSNLWESVKDILNGIIDFIRGVFTGNWKRAWQGVKEVFGGIFKGLAALLKAPINAVISLINGALNRINTLIRRVNSGVGSKLGFTMSELGNIPYLAKGGILSRGSAIVGEAGPELLTMNGNRAVVQPLTATLDSSSIHALNGGGQTQTNVSINFEGDLARLAAILQPVIAAETTRRGISMINA